MATDLTNKHPHSMKKLFLPLLAFFLLSALGCRPQTTLPATPSVVILRDGLSEYPLGLYLAILEDPGGQLTIDDVTSAAYAGQFTPSQSGQPDFGYTDSAYWVRFHVQNKTSRLNDWRLEVDFANMGLVDFYRPLPSGRGFELVQTGRYRPATSRDVVHPQFVFALPLPLQADELVYLRFANESAMQLSLTLWSRPAFEQDSTGEQLGLGMAYGIMLALLLYNLFLLVSSIEETNYLWYCLFIVSAIFYQAYFDGLGSLYLWPNLYDWDLSIGFVSIILMLVFLLRFTMVFLQTGRYTPRLHRFFTLLILGYGLLLLLFILTGEGAIIRSALLWLLVTLFMTTGTAFVIWRRGFRPAGFFLLGWVLFFLGVFAYVLGRMHLLPITPWLDQVIRPGLIGVMLMSSLALGDRINLLKTAAAKTGQQLRENERKLAQFLEALPVGVVIYDAEGQVYHINPLGRQMSDSMGQGLRPGQSLEEVLQSSTRYLAGTNEPYPPQQLPLLRALAGERITIDNMEIEQGGRRIPLQLWGTPILDEAGQVQNAIVAFQDISELKQAEAQRQQIMSEALERERYLREAAYTLSSSLELPAIFANLMQVAAGVVRADGGLLSLISADGQSLHVVNSLGMPTGTILRPLGQGDKGLSWSVYQSGRPVLLPEYREHPDAIPALVEGGVRALLIVPIIAQEMRLGTLGLFTLDVKKQFDQRDLALAETIGRQVGVAIHNARLFQAEQQARQVAETLRAANLALSQSLNMDTILAILLDYLHQLVNYDSASVLLFDGEDRLVIRASQGYERWQGRPLGMVMDVPMTPNLERLITTGRSFAINDTTSYPGWLDIAGLDYIHSWLGVPFIASGRVIGLYSIDKAEAGYFTAEHIQLAEGLATQAALSIQNALLYQAEREQFNRLQISQAQLIQAEKMSALGRLSASIAHEINNPLQAIQGCLTLLDKSIPKEQRVGKVDRYLEIVSGEIERIAAIVRRMRGFYQPSAEDWRPTSVAAVIDSILELSAKQLQHSHIVVQWTATEDLPAVWANVNNLKQVLLNLVLNALDSMPDGGTLSVAVSKREMTAKHKGEVQAAVCIEISDTGVGMSPEVASRIFEPFYTTKAQGSGLGLAISYGIIEAHEGQLSVKSRPGEGTTFTILLPAMP
jgi:PAS domain S-box-containing protein